VRRPQLQLFLISFLILFYELAAIRWFAATVIFLTFFTNIVLLACFLGMSVGLLTARRPQSFVASALPLARQHCAKYDRVPRLSDPGLDVAIFDCVHR